MTAPLADVDEQALFQILSRTADGDRDSIAELYQHTAPRVLAVAWGILQNRADAEEVAFDVYGFVWRHAQRYDSRRGPVIAWLVVICRSRALDRLRKVRGTRQAAVTEESSFETPDSALYSEQIMATVHTALQRLSPMRRQLVQLSFFEEKSHSQIAAQLGIPLGTAKSLIRRTLMRLRRELALGCG